MKTPSYRNAPANPSASVYREPPGDEPAPSDRRMPVLAEMLTSILFGIVMLPLGLWATWRGAAELVANLNREITAGRALGVFVPCAGVVIASIAIMRLSAGFSLLRRDARALARARAAARVSFWGDGALVLGLLLTGGGYGVAMVVFVSPV